MGKNLFSIKGKDLFQLIWGDALCYIYVQNSDMLMTISNEQRTQTVAIKHSSKIWHL